MLEYSLEVAVFAENRQYPISQDCMTAFFHFVSAHTVFPSLSNSLLQNLCWSKRLHSRSIPELLRETHSDSFSYLSKMAVRELYAISVEIPIRIFYFPLIFFSTLNFQKCILQSFYFCAFFLD